MALPIPVPGVSDIIDLLVATNKWFDQRRKQQSLKAWREADFGELCHVLVKYYESRNVPLFAYPGPAGVPIKVPVYVRPEWSRLTEQSLDKHFEPVKRPYSPKKAQEDFLTFYREMRRDQGLGDVWDGTIFRLTNIQTSPNQVRLEFEEGQFLHSMMCHYILEHELVVAQPRESASGNLQLKLREEVSGSVQAIESFCKRDIVCRAGVSNLILLRSEAGHYLPVIQKRGAQSLARGLCPVSSGVFDVTTKPKDDFDLKHKVLKEVYEELFGNPDVVKETKNFDSRFFYPQDGVSDLLKLLEQGEAKLEVTGLCIDLIRMIPEITTVLVVRDVSYYKRHLEGPGARFLLNEEYRLTSDIHIPRSIQDADHYLAHEMLTDPDGEERGFDPLRWTLPGAFCFYQGLKRAVSSRLL